MLDRMPDENTNPVWTAQTSQNDQATTNQTWNDFTLDFWWEEDNNKTESEWIELNLDERNKEWNLWNPGQDIDLGFNDDSIDWDLQESNINIQDLDSIFDKNQNTESNISSIGIKDDKNENNQNKEGNDNSENKIPYYEENKIEESDNQVESEESDNQVESEELDNQVESEESDNQEESETQEQDNQEFSISLEDETENLQNQQENNEVEKQISLNEEEKENNNQEIWYETEEETLDLNSNLEDNTENDNSSESVEKEKNQKIDENVSDEKFWDEEELQSKWDDFSISFDDTTDWNDHTETGLKDNDDIDKENQDVKTEHDEIMNEKNLVIESKENLVESEDTINASSENTEIDLPSAQENSLEEKNEENLENTVNVPETPSEIGNEKDSAERTDKELNQEIAIEDSTNNQEFSDDNLTQTKINNEITENQDNTPDDFVMNFNLQDENDSKSENQPEIWDLLWDSSDNFSLETPSAEKDEENSEYNYKMQQDDVKDLNEINLIQEESQAWIANDDQKNWKTGVQDFTLEYEDAMSDKKEEDREDNIAENVDNNTETQKETETLEFSESLDNQTASTYNLDDVTTIKDGSLQESTKKDNDENSNNQDLQQNQIDQVNDLSESISAENNEEKTDKAVKDIGISTLSLDQILDSELNSNPQYSDNSKAVPKNVPLNSWFFNKKTVWIMAVVLILAGAVAVLAFPTKKTPTKEWSVAQYTWSEIEDHYSWDEPIESTIGDLEIETEKTIEWTVDSGYTTQEKHDNPKIDEFPDRNPWEDDIEPPVAWNDKRDIISVEPEPYTCTDDDCLVVPETTEEEITITPEEIETIIWKYKSEAEKYYTLWDDNQDKKLIKYSLQIINLCDNYQFGIENGEENMQENFEELNSKIIWIRSKIERYIGGGDDVESFTQSSFKEEYDFEWKDELLDLINGEDN